MEVEGIVTRVSVFIDYQNVYHFAREAFSDPHTDPPTSGTSKSLRRRR